MCLIIGLKISAQTIFTDDAAIWTGIEIQRKINKKTSLSFSQQCRFDENVTQLGRASFGIDGFYKINKNLRINYGYTFLKKIDDDLTYYNENRLNTGFTAKKDFRKWEISLRNISQMRFKKYFTSEDGKIPKIYNRSRIELNYEINKRYSAYHSHEIYVPLNKTEVIEINRLRSITGFSYNFSKKTSIKSYFLFQRQFHTDEYIERKFVYGVEFSHEL